MPDVESFVFNLNRVDSFIDQINIGFRWDEMVSNAKNFRFKFASQCPTSIDLCLNGNGTLNTSLVTVIDEILNDGEISMIYEAGVNGDRVVSVPASSVNIDLADMTVPIMGVFLENIDTGYILAYSILPKAITVSGHVIFPTTGIVWNIHNGV